jgi:hypothetical protein
LIDHRWATQARSQVGGQRRGMATAQARPGGMVAGLGEVQQAIIIRPIPW